MKKFLFFAITIMCLSIFSGTGVAEENKNHLTLEQRDSIIEAFDKAGLNTETKEKILSKLDKGELLDSQNPEMLGKGKIEKTEGKDEYGNLTRIITTTYPDGSVTIQSISGGTTSCGTGYCHIKGAVVSHLSGTTYGSFKADYTFVNGDYDVINSVYEWDISGVGSLGNIELIKAQEKETYDANAYAYLRFTGTVPGDFYTATFYLRLYVGGNDAWTNANW